MNKMILTLLALLFSTNVHAWVATGGHGGYYHGGTYYHGGSYYHHGYYYNEGWAAPGVMIGVPSGAYYGYGCRIVQICGHSGCENKRLCE